MCFRLTVLGCGDVAVKHLSEALTVNTTLLSLNLFGLPHNALNSQLADITVTPFFFFPLTSLHSDIPPKKNIAKISSKMSSTYASPSQMVPPLTPPTPKLAPPKGPISKNWDLGFSKVIRSGLPEAENCKLALFELAPPRDLRTLLGPFAQGNLSFVLIFMKIGYNCF